MQLQHSNNSFKDKNIAFKIKKRKTAIRNKEILDNLGIEYIQSECGNKLTLMTPQGKVYFTLSTGYMHVCETKKHKRGIKALLTILGCSTVLT